jgi:Nitrogen regulatory protein P-II
MRPSGADRQAGGAEGPGAAQARIDLVVPDEIADSVAGAIAKSVSTGTIGDGKIWVSTVDSVLRCRTAGRPRSSARAADVACAISRGSAQRRRAWPGHAGVAAPLAAAGSALSLSTTSRRPRPARSADVPDPGRLRPGRPWMPPRVLPRDGHVRHPGWPVASHATCAATVPWHTWESDPGCARGEPTCRAVRSGSANRRCAIASLWLSCEDLHKPAQGNLRGAAQGPRP